MTKMERAKIKEGGFLHPQFRHVVKLVLVSIAFSGAIFSALHASNILEQPCSNKEVPKTDESSNPSWQSAVLERTPLAADWQCDSHPDLKAFNLTSFPLHYLPARGSMPHASIFAETEWGTCDLISPTKSLDPCRSVAQGSSEAPDTWLEEFIDVLLSRDPDCRESRHPSKGSSSISTRRCSAVDVGANLGLVSLRLLQMGANVISIEPQVDLCCAGRQSAIYNGFGDNSLFLCGGLTPGQGGGTLTIGENFYRVGGAFRSKSFLKAHGLPYEVPLYPLEEVFKERKHYSFLKLDTDSVDCDLLRLLVDKQRRGELTFDSASLETWTGLCSNNEQFSQLLYDLQQDGYSIYRTPAMTRNSAGSDGFLKRRPTRDTFPNLTESHLDLPTTTLLKFKSMTLHEWREVDKSWRKKYQCSVTKIPLHDLSASSSPS